MDTIEAILTRRSVRHFTTEDVSEEDLEEILKCAMYAPSANNRQPWHFIVINSRQLLNKIPDIHPYSKCLYEAPAAIVVCGDDNLSNHQESWIQGCSAATQNILLAARAKSLGSVWLGVYPNETRINAIRGILELPDHIHPLSLIAIGHPDETPITNERYNPDRIHKNRW